MTDKIQGEGNYEAAKAYDDGATATAADKAKVEKAAREARDALDTPEGDDLAAAEAEGKSHAKA